MLVLTRKKNESIICELENGERIVFHVVEIRGNNVRIGTNAPSKVRVLRNEIAQLPPPSPAPAAA